MAQLLTYPDHTLLQISGYVRHFDDPNLKTIIDEMKKTMKENDLEALAAIQIGIPLRIVVLKKEDDFQVFINPAIYGKEGEYAPSMETDESLPGVTLTVRRYPVIKVMYQDEEGKEHFYRAEGDEAIALQRKIDMTLGGYLFDKLSKKEKKKFFKEYGSFGDTCPSYFVKDKILKALRFFLTAHAILLILSLFATFAKFILVYNTPIFLLEIAWIFFYALYAKYETTKYKNCTSCQGANILGTSAIYTAVTILLYIFSWIARNI